jgi:hypothetical protein
MDPNAPEQDQPGIILQLAQSNFFPLSHSSPFPIIASPHTLGKQLD